MEIDRGLFSFEPEIGMKIKVFQSEKETIILQNNDNIGEKEANTNYLRKY